MKILLAEQIREVDKQTLSHLNISSQQLMGMAADAIYRWFIHHHMKYQIPISVICGTGNNGGDGIALATSLHLAGARVKAYIIDSGRSHSLDFQYYFQRATDNNVLIKVISSETKIPSFMDSEIIIDAMLGTGINSEISGLTQKVIEIINQTNIYTISIDVPSGLMLDKETKFAIIANETITLQIPKLALFLPNNHKYTGSVSIINFGLSKKAIDEAKTNLHFITKQNIKQIIKPLDKLAHKGTQGHSLIIGGSKGKIGSVALASKAALRSGCGLVTAYTPRCGTIPLQSSVPEVMIMEDKGDNKITDIQHTIIPNAIGIGIGMGTNEETKFALVKFLKENKSPLVIDADAINIISNDKELLKYLPIDTILTPHPKELYRLIGTWKNDFDKINMTVALAKKYNIIIIIKGANSLIITPDQLLVNSTGTPALATAGSGDVLTGILTGLLSQGYSPLDASKIGVYLHGLTANITSNTIHPLSFIASDIIDNIGDAYFKIINDEDIDELNNYYSKND